MILREVTVQGLGCFAGEFTLGPLAPGINIVHAPNGRGKTTLFRSIALGFLEPHRTKSKTLEELRPWGRRLAPQVTVEFTHKARTYRLHKRFLDRASSRVESLEGIDWNAFAQGDDADQFLREVLESETDRPKSANVAHWGFAQVLWTTQGEMRLPELAPGVLESIRQSVGAQLTSGDAELVAAIEAKALEFFTGGGKLRTGRQAAPQVRLEAERARLIAELQGAAELLAQFEADATRIERLRETVVVTQRRRGELTEAIEDARRRAAQYVALNAERRIATSKRDTASATFKGLRERIDGAARARQQLQRLREEVGAAEAALPELVQRRDAAVDVSARHECERERLIAAEQEAHAAMHRAQQVFEYTRVRELANAHAGRIDAVEAAESRYAAAAALHSAVRAPSEAKLRTLRTLTAAASDLARRLELARITLTFEPETRIDVEVTAGEQIGRVECEPGVPVMLAGSPNLAFTIVGTGKFEARGPASDYEALRGELVAAREQIRAYEAEFGSADPDVLAARVWEAAEHLSQMKAARASVLNLLEGGTLEGLQREKARLASIRLQFESEHPEWITAAPDGATWVQAANAAVAAASAELRAAEEAAALARKQSADAGLALRDVENRIAACNRQMHEAAQVLEHATGDGLTDAERQRLVNEAAVEHHGIGLELERLQNELARFPVDPAVEVDRYARELARSQSETEAATAELVRAEASLAHVLGRKPLDMHTRAAEELASIEEQLGRERLRMAALALLKKTMSEVRTEVMMSVAGPVERTASRYLDEICGSKLADIRLTESLSTGSMTPAGCEGEVAIDRFSGGEREQIFLATRLALGCEIAREEPQMVVLDDVLSFTDCERMERVCGLLARLSSKLQIVILTCHPERFEALAGAHRIGIGRGVRVRETA